MSAAAPYCAVAVLAFAAGWFAAAIGLPLLPF